MNLNIRFETNARNSFFIEMKRYEKYEQIKKIIHIKNALKRKKKTLKQSRWRVRQHTQCLLANRDHVSMCGIRRYCAEYILRPRHYINLWHGGKYCIFNSYFAVCVMISRSYVCVLLQFVFFSPINLFTKSIYPYIYTYTYICIYYL